MFVRNMFESTVFPLKKENKKALLSCIYKCDSYVESLTKSIH